MAIFILVNVSLTQLCYGFRFYHLNNNDLDSANVFQQLGNIPLVNLLLGLIIKFRETRFNEASGKRVYVLGLVIAAVNVGLNMWQMFADITGVVSIIMSVVTMVPIAVTVIYQLRSLSTTLRKAFQTNNNDVTVKKIKQRLDRFCVFLALGLAIVLVTMSLYFVLLPALIGIGVDKDTVLEYRQFSVHVGILTILWSCVYLVFHSMRKAIKSVCQCCK